MKYLSILLIGVIFPMLFLTGCGSAGDGIEISKIEPIHIGLLKTADAHKTALYHAALQRGGISNEGFPMSEVKAYNIKFDTICERLKELLTQSDLFTSVEYQGKLFFLPKMKDSEMLLLLDCNEKITYDKMASATSAGITGFVSLGALPSNNKYYYTLEMKLRVLASSGQVKEYTASSSADVLLTAYQHEVGRRWQAIDKARHQLSINNINYLIHQMVQDQNVYLK